MLEASLVWFGKKHPARHALNVLIARSFSAAGVAVVKEPAGLSRSDGKRPDGISIVPWQNNEALCWHMIVICPLVDWYISDAARDAGAVPELTASRKEVKCADLDCRYTFASIEIRELGNTKRFNSPAPFKTWQEVG